MFAVGLCSKGIVSLGFLSIGAVSVGLMSLGLAALGIGCFSMGALSIGKYIAVGETKAVGSLYQAMFPLSSAELETVKGLLDANVPAFLNVAKNFILRMIS